MKFNFLIFLSIIFYSAYLPAQTCVYQAYEAFDYNANISLHSLSGGNGWASVWYVQNESTTVPGYQIVNVPGSLAYGQLQTIGRFATGGEVYLTSGRALNVSDSGPFANLVEEFNSGIGTMAQGDTLWVSFLLRKDQNNAEDVYVDLHNDPFAACPNCASQHIAVGYFDGGVSDVGGQRRWTLRLNNNYFPSSEQVVIGNSVFSVLRIIFNSGSTQVDWYVNPPNLGDNPPATATISQATGAENIIRSFAYYAGSFPANSALDEIRFATSYACVAPDNTVSVNLPPQAVITANTTSGMTPLNINFDAGNSSDPENGALTYLWDFGDGSPASTSETPTHTYTALGNITVSLTATDDVGLEQTVYETITVLDENGTYPCQSSFTVLNMPDCSNTNGAIQINNTSVSFSLRDDMNQLMSVSNGNEYHNLSAGVYNFTADGGAGGCRDTFMLHLQVDSTTCAGWEAPACAMQIGTNMSFPIDWSPERPFKNLLKHGRPEPIAFTEACFCWELPILNEITFDANGYPTHLPQTTSQGDGVLRYFLSSENNIMTVGQDYVLLYDGIGTIEIIGGTNVISTPGRITFTAAGDGTTWLNLLSSNVADHVRNIRVLRIADEFEDLVAAPFYQGFLDKITPFAMLRFMDWGSINNNPVMSWSERTEPDYFTYATNTGVPYEIMIQLANTTQKDVWICVPHLADDNYIQQIATLFRDSLDNNLNVYLEYSNEVWNWIFDQSYYNDENRPSNLNYGRAYAEKAKNAFQIWHSVFGNESSRVKRVLGIQTTYNYLNEQILSQLDQDDWDVGSPTHYFGLDHEATGNPVLSASATVADIMTNAHNYWLTNLPYFKADYNQIKLFGKEICTYEGGQHFVGNVFGIPYDYQQAMWDAQLSTQMYDMYTEVLDTFRTWGCTLAGNFSLASAQESVYGSWGVLDNIDIAPPYATTAPKYQALLDYIDGCSLFCEAFLGINDNPLSSGDFQAANAIHSAALIPNTANVNFTAGDSILLQEGFWAQAGAFFEAKIENCGVQANTVTETEEETLLDNTLKTVLEGDDFLYYISPNPVMDIATITYFIPQNERLHVRIYNINGTLVYQKALAENTIGWHSIRINTQPLAQGMYVVQLQSSKQSRQVKMMVVH
ncbi:MAG: PKD domain-containing protein [Chitinophagales bacterium]|nr:T9SS type A sorting domain-containing protein [Bacteroidota bacterium]MCB9044281.1 T9SS type A sorting domain-containing protein [Chitinophagales bacterium]